MINTRRFARLLLVWTAALLGALALVPLLGRPAAAATAPASDGVRVLRMPDHAGLLSPILHSVPLQLLAYHVAVEKGTDVDKPRNLAKSVTVE